MPFQVFDAWDQAALTDEITRPPAGRAPGAAEDTADRGPELAPMKDVNTRTVKVRVREITPFGVGQFKAPSASPGLVTFGNTWTEKTISLALLEEVHMIDTEEWQKMNSEEENVRRSAGLDYIERGQIMKTRMDRLTEKMRWDALLNGVLTITYPLPLANTLQINYGYSAGHQPTASPLWTSVSTADPVADVQTWSELLADDAGFYARYVWMNSKTFDLLVRNQKIISTINFFANGANSIQRPRRQDILELFSSFFVNQAIEIYDNGYRAVGQTGIGRPSLTKFLPDNKVLVTGPYEVDGLPIAQTLQGLVEVPTGYNSTAIVQGFQAYTQLDQFTMTHYLRVASARMVRINYPDAILAATVG